jgi:hypothetical protein
VPIPLVIVTVLPEIEQAPPARMDAKALELVLDTMVNVELYGALAGAPANTTVGAILLAAVDWVAVAEL